MIYKHNGSIITDIGGKWLSHTDTPAPPVDPYNPLGLPANTIRVKFKSGYTPSMGDSQTLVDSTNNVWDIYKESNGWTALFMKNTNLIEVLGANTSDVTAMGYMFRQCTALTTVPLFDTSNVTALDNMFEGTSITSIPLFNTTNVTYISYMFSNCRNVESGALALYQQASSQANPPPYHEGTFQNCGRDTVTGAAELAQIPSNWK